ncbi:MAG: hypothetical protein CL424_18670 [Acidimicrobiaceae bacterium]|nr:hypothetical protein [Acidimicrobiaceae bacterium]
MSIARGRSLRSRLTRRLVGLGLVSVVLLAAVNLVVVYGLLERGATNQLNTLRNLRADTVEHTVENTLDRVAVLGTDPGVGAALADLSAAYLELDEGGTDISETELDQLVASYAEVTDRYDAVDAVRPPTDDLVPDSAAGRYVQFHYTAANETEPRSDLDDAADGSAYSEAHAEHHPFLRDLATSLGASDVLLVDLTTAEVVYSVSKRIDLGTDVTTGPYAGGGLGTAIDKLEGTPVDAAAVADTSFYLPDTSAPVVHMATSVRSRAEVLGAVVVVLHTDRLTEIVTSGQQWDLLGLGDTGDAYLVGADRRLRTVPRPWFDDPDAYLERYLDIGGDERAAELMAFTGSPVLLQPVDNDAVDVALEGDAFTGSTTNFLGRTTLTAASPVDVADLGWIVVTEQEVDETRDELERFVLAIVVVLAVLLSVLAVVGVVLARVLARPVRPLVEAAGRIAEGDYHTEVPDLGNNELGDVGRQLEAVAARLREQEASIEAEEDRINEMLASVLPPALVDRVRSGERELAEVVDTATVVSISIRGIPIPSGAEQDAVVELTTRLADEAAAVAQAHGVERAQAALEHQTFVAGRGTPTVDTRRAVAFARDIVDALPRAAAELGSEISVAAGLSAGLVATGVLGSRQVTFGVWGTPVGAAVELGDRARQGEIRIDSSVFDELDDDATVPVDGADDEWTLTAADPIVEPAADPASGTV